MAAALAGGEIALRASWCSSPAARYEHQSRPFLSSNPYWGVWHFPRNEVRHHAPCFDALYRTNELGMRGGPIRPGGRRIALLGDSFVEGMGNDEDEIAAHFLGERLGPEFQVLNFGVSGYFSTIDELVLYDNFARFFDPEIVILFFLNYNDLEDLLDPVKEQFIDRDLNFVYRRVETRDEILTAVSEQEAPDGAERRESRWCIVRLLYFGGRALGQQLQAWVNLRWDLRRALARPYIPEEDAKARRAWAIVETSLARLHALTRARGTKLVVVDIADPYQLDPNWLQLTSLRSGVALSPHHPGRRLGEICAKLGIAHYYDMFDDAQAYVRERGLGFPGLSFRCDRHYGREGQELMANLVFRYLQSEGLVDR
ncbi:MAG: SGNH/GDSL hydrolase family protein [Deltaproteobacteria bacterium]|nr:SGNH/GDSL hydrolase family protein [Deltaproteobacteria bacterium]